jgi:L-ascorbate metabolism protein UlaG (beta-lactamase superfamily)
VIVEYDGLSFERLHHANITITTADGTVVYIDPWSDALPVDPALADVIFVTHDDVDHYDPEAIESIATDETTIVAFDGIDTSALSRPVTAVGVDETGRVGGIEIRTVPAYNRAGGDHVDTEGNPFHADGDGIGFLLGIDKVMVFVPGDTDFLEDHENLAADVIVPPIGGHYTMDRHEAAALVRAVEADLVLPVHYDTFEAIETDAEAFKRDLEADGIAVELF